MTPEEEAADKARKVQRAQAAAASATYAGATEDEITAAVRAGIAEAKASPLYRGPQQPAYAAH